MSIQLVKANLGGPWTDVLARIPARKTPYAIFLLLLAALYGAAKSRNSTTAICNLLPLPAANDCKSRCRRPVLPYAIFLPLLATAICTQFFPKRARRPVRISWTKLLRSYATVFKIEKNLNLILLKKYVIILKKTSLPTGPTAIENFEKHRLPLLSSPGLSNSQNLGPHMPQSFKLSPLYFYLKKSRQIYHNLIFLKKYDIIYIENEKVIFLEYKGGHIYV